MYGEGMKKYLWTLVLALLWACNIHTNQPDLTGKTVSITFIHTTDIHSRLYPYYMVPNIPDQNLGLDKDDGPYGGAARMAYVIRRERAKANRSLYIDTGDWFQGAPVFNVFHGEPEIRVMDYMGLDVACIGNHDFDLGRTNLEDQLASWASFPVLAANYHFDQDKRAGDHDLSSIVKPYAIFNLKGITVGVIGLGNVSTLSSLMETGNKLGITPIDSAQVMQFYIDLLKDRVNIIVGATHLGLTEDPEMIARTTGLDIVFGGHHHVVLDPPKTVMDCTDPAFKAKRHCKSRRVILVHSGAFAKYVGVLDTAFAPSKDDPMNWELQSFKYTPYPIDSKVPEDQYVKELLEPYYDELKKAVQLDLIVGYSPSTIKRTGSSGGDSALGNIVAESMWRRQSVETDFAVTNTTGMRADMYQGPVTIEDLYNIFPWQNTITKMFLSGRDVIELFDYAARRSQKRGCVSQVQVAGARVELFCGPCTESSRPKDWPQPREPDKACAQKIEIDGMPVRQDAQYELATNNYIARGGSGFYMLKANTTQHDTGINMRNALIDYIRQMKPCGADDTGQTPACTSDADCPKDYQCACDGRYVWDAASSTCKDTGQCAQGGHCALSACVDGVTDRFGRECVQEKNTQKDINECKCTRKNLAAQQCTKAACLDSSNGVVEDQRVKMVLP